MVLPCAVEKTEGYVCKWVITTCSGLLQLAVGGTVMWVRGLLPRAAGDSDVGEWVITTVSIVMWVNDGLLPRAAGDSDLGKWVITTVSI